MKKGIISVVGVIFSLSLISGAAHAESKRISSDNACGCMNRDYYTKLLDYSVQNDLEAFKKGLVAGILAGQCTMFKTGEEVFIADTAIFSGLVKVRRQGSIEEYWTTIEAVK
jgi:hypothetical protein